MQAFRTSFPDVEEFTAWNEPNHPSTSTGGAAVAASYWNTLNSVCQSASSTGKRCVVAAGDLADGASMPSYQATYKSNLSATPSVWAIHLYGAVQNGDGTYLNQFMQNTDNKPVWVTEVGAYYCNGTVFGNASQRLVAINIRTFGDLYASRIRRIYYYQFAFSGTASVNCPNSPWEDTMLIDQGQWQRPAARIIRDDVPLPFVYENGQWYMRYSFTTGTANTQFAWRTPDGVQPGDEPLMGDWDGDGIATPGIHRGNLFYLYSSNDPWGGVSGFIFGDAGDRAIVGDWNGDGVDTIALQRGNIFYVSNVNSTGGTSPDDYALQYGDAGDIGVGGDWNGDNVDTLGVVKGNVWYLLNGRTSTSPGEAFIYGDAGDVPVTGDWDGDGRDDPGVYVNGTWYLSYAHGPSGPGVAFDFGAGAMAPVVGG